MVRPPAIGLDVGIRWSGGDIDRVADEGHAALVGRAAALLEGFGWQVRPRARSRCSVSVDRSISSLGILTARILLVIEVQTALQLRGGDPAASRRKGAPRRADRGRTIRMARAVRSASPRSSLPDLSTPRRRVAASRLRAGAGPTACGGVAARTWLDEPSGPVRGCCSSCHPLRPGSGRRTPVTPRRVRLRRSGRAEDHPIAPVASLTCERPSAARLALPAGVGDHLIAPVHGLLRQWSVGDGPAAPATAAAVGRTGASPCSHGSAGCATLGARPATRAAHRRN